MARTGRAFPAPAVPLFRRHLQWPSNSSENPQARILVRANAPDHWAHAADLELCRRHVGVIGVLLPKAESAGQVLTAAATEKPIWPIIESARGLAALNEIASAQGVERLSFGSLDLGLDLNLTTGSRAAEEVLSHARYAVLLCTRVADLAPALDGVFPSIEDTAGLHDAVQFARDMGFGGALALRYQVLIPCAAGRWRSKPADQRSPLLIALVQALRDKTREQLEQLGQFSWQ